MNAVPLRDETARCEAALIILAMNASLWLVRWLSLFFRSFLSLFPYVFFLQALNIEIYIYRFNLLYITILL